MAFNFDSAIKEAQQDLTNKKLFMILLGSSGNGKSYAQGTLGVKTLYLYTQGENHGPKSASTVANSNIVPICIDRDGDRSLTADEALARLHSILGDVDALKKMKFGAISLDGATEIEHLIRNSSKYKVAVKTTYDEGPATMGMFRDILNRLKSLQRELGIHVVMTCILNVKEYGEDGLILDSTPSLHGYQVATGLTQQFDDVMVIGRMQKGNKVAYRIQLLAGVNKDTKDFTTKEVRKTFNFSPRLTGASIVDMGSTVDADLGALAKLKEGSKE